MVSLETIDLLFAIVDLEITVVLLIWQTVRYSKPDRDGDDECTSGDVEQQRTVLQPPLYNSPQSYPHHNLSHSRTRYKERRMRRSRHKERS